MVDGRCQLGIPSAISHQPSVICEAHPQKRGPDVQFRFTPGERAGELRSDRDGHVREMGLFGPRLSDSRRGRFIADSPNAMPLRPRIRSQHSTRQDLERLDQAPISSARGRQ
jgi:hypothetical protein